MAKIVDPDQLNQSTQASSGAPDGEVYIDTSAKTIELIVFGNLDDSAPGKSSGVTGQALYSFLKEEWKADSTLNKFKFPMKMIYEASFQLINGWAFSSLATEQTKDLIRDAGYQDTTNNDKYACVISLGDMDNPASDLAYYQQTAGFDQTTSVFDKTGELNEVILIDDGVTDNTGYLKLFLREQGKTYADYSLLTEQGLSALKFEAYRAPLENETDLEIVDNDATVGGANDPYQNMGIDYVVGNGFTTWADSTSYSVDDVVLDPLENSNGSSNGKWFRATSSGTSSGTGTGDDVGVTWEAYPGERQIGDEWYAFNRIIDADSVNTATKEEVHTFAQYKLRQSTNINDDSITDGYGTVNGDVAVVLTDFIGSQLHTNPGVYVDFLDANDNNDVSFWDITVDGGGLDSEDVPVTTTERTNPFFASFNLNFSTNLVSETNADTLFRVYFTNDDAGDNLGNDFDTSGAIVVNDKDGTPIEGQIDTAQKTFQYDYSGNTQRGTGSAGTDAPITVVFQGLNDSEWNSAEFTIQQSTGQNFACNAPDELNYNNPA